MNKSLERWAKAEIDKYQDIILLQDHKIFFKYDKSVDDGAIMECDPRYPYKVLTIRYGKVALEEWKKPDHGELHDTIIHELVHAITEPLYRKAILRYTSDGEINDERERLTDHITNIITKLK